MEKLSKRQLQTIYHFGESPCRIHYGPMGCGKSYALADGLAFWCKGHKSPGGNNHIALVGQTIGAIKTNIGNYLTSMCGSNFYYTSSTKDGLTKDAVLYGHLIKTIGLHDASAEGRIRGCNAYGILGDEVSLWSEDNFLKLFGRLRGELPEGCDYWAEFSTNPSSPSHWLLSFLNNGTVPVNVNGESVVKSVAGIHWDMNDNVTSGAKVYYDRLINLYKDNPALLQRYVYGEWTVADDLVYMCFKPTMLYDAYELDNAFYKSYRIGVDWGTENPTAIITAGIMPDNEVCILREIYVREVTVSQIANMIINAVNRCGGICSGVYIDPSAKALKLELSKKGLYVIDAVNDVIPGIDYVRELMVTGKFAVSNDCKNVKRELTSYCFSKKEGEVVKKENDHAMDAIRYLCYTPFKKGLS